MPASDWIRSKLVPGVDLTDQEWQLILDNNQQSDDYCGMTVESAKILLNSGKYYGLMYTYAGEKVLISFLDKSTTDRQMWRLAFFSFNPVHVDANTIADLIVRAIREMMLEQYFGKVSTKGNTVRGIYYYNLLTNVGSNPMFERVLDKIERIFRTTNFDGYIDFSAQIEGSNVTWYLTYKGM